MGNLQWLRSISFVDLDGDFVHRCCTCLAAQHLLTGRTEHDEPLLQIGEPLEVLE